MIAFTKQLNEILRGLSKEHANSSISQFTALIDLCTNAGIRFSYDENYPKALATFKAHKFPAWKTEITNLEIESLANHGKYEKAALKRDETASAINEIHKQFRLEKYGTEDWFIENSECEILFLPTEIAVIDRLILEKINERNTE